MVLDSLAYVLMALRLSVFGVLRQDLALWFRLAKTHCVVQDAFEPHGLTA